MLFHHSSSFLTSDKSVELLTVFEPNKMSFPSSKVKSELPNKPFKLFQVRCHITRNYTEELLGTQNASVQPSASLLQEEGGEELSKEKGSSSV